MGADQAGNLDDGSVKVLLNKWRSGDDASRDELFSRLYSELCRISASLLNREGGASLTTGDLVNEAALRLIDLERIEWEDKAHFLALSALTMRRVLIDHARKKKSDKRAHQKVTLVTHLEGGVSDNIDIHLLESVLVRLHAIDEVRAKIVEMRYYGGLTLDEIAGVTGMSVSNVKRNWRASRSWLLNALEEERARML